MLRKKNIFFDLFNSNLFLSSCWMTLLSQLNCLTQISMTSHSVVKVGVIQLPLAQHTHSLTQHTPQHSQHIHAAHSLSALSTLIQHTHSLSTLAQHTHSTHSLSTPTHHTRSAHSLSTLTQHTISAHSLSTRTQHLPLRRLIVKKNCSQATLFSHASLNYTVVTL